MLKSSEKKKKLKMKKKVGLFSFTCCEGCIIVFIEALNTKYDEWTSKMNITNFRALKKVQPITKMDLAIVEGAITTPHEIEKLEKIRQKTSKLIAFGSGACNGYPSNQRNNFSQKLKQEIQPLIEKFNQIGMWGYNVQFGELNLSLGHGLRPLPGNDRDCLLRYIRAPAHPLVQQLVGGPVKLVYDEVLLYNRTIHHSLVEIDCPVTDLNFFELPSTCLVVSKEVIATLCQRGAGD